MNEDRLLLPGADGLMLVASAFGPTDGLPVLLAHGGGQTRRAWRKVATRLGRAEYRAIALDLRGHGESPWSQTGDYDVHDFGRDLVAVAQSFERNPALIGASLGGLAGLVAEGIIAPGIRPVPEPTTDVPVAAPSAQPAATRAPAPSARKATSAPVATPTPTATATPAPDPHAGHDMSTMSDEDMKAMGHN